MNAKIGRSMSANSNNINFFSGNVKASFDDFINENYFEISRKEDNLPENLEIYHGISKNPFTYQKDIFLGFLIKSKYDGIGNRKPIDLSIALDISGSMSSRDGIGNSRQAIYKGKSRMFLAKESLKKLINILDEKNDRISLLTFNDKIKHIFGLIQKEEIENKYLKDIELIESSGGTNLLGAIEEALNIFSNENNNKIRRILCITDAFYKDENNELYNLIKKIVEEKIYI